MSNTDLLKIIPTLQSASLVSDNLDFFKKGKKKSLVKRGVKNIVGISLIKETTKNINF